MPKRPIGISVLDASKERISITFDEFEEISVSYSGGKDSTVMLHLVMDEAIKRNRIVNVLFIDLEGQYEITIKHISDTLLYYEKYIKVFWVCLPIHLRNAVSVFETHWICWDKNKKEAWVRNPPTMGIFDENYFPFFREGMEFEEFVPEFGEWLSNGKKVATFVGIRSDESLNRFRTISSLNKKTYKNIRWTTKVSENSFNIYPIYDWKTKDIWIYHGKNPSKIYNRLYDLMHKAGLTINQMRICQPYGDDQRRGLWLFHLIEPATWSKIVARVNGANSGSIYIQESGNVTGYRTINKPKNHTWKSFSKLLIDSMPPRTKEHYKNKVAIFQKWWKSRGYEEGIPEEADHFLESERKVPSRRRVCKSLLRNDYWCKGLSFTHKSTAYTKYLNLMKKRKSQWEPTLFDW